MSNSIFNWSNFREAYTLHCAEKSEHKKAWFRWKSGFCVFLHFVLVELRGIEPRSKQVTKKLSTCLAYDYFSTGNRPWAAYYQLILCFLHEHRDTTHASSVFDCTPKSNRPRTFLGGMSRLSTCREI